MNFSIVIPIYNEEGNIKALYDSITTNLDSYDRNYEVILVDDGSTDSSYSLLKELSEKDIRFKIVKFRRNFGQTAAMSAGFNEATSPIVIPMDGDLQNDPKDIPHLIAKINEGYDVVSGWRKNRQDTFITRKIPSKIANNLISKMTGVYLHDYGCTLKAYKKDVLEGINLYGEMHRFVPALASQVGAKVIELPVNHHPRIHGVSKYGISRTLRVILDLITVNFLLKYSTKPIQLFGKLGVYTIFFGFLTGVATLYMKFFEAMSINRNPLFIITVFLTFVGIQFIIMGLLAELITRTYHESQNKPIYVIKEKINF